MPPDPGPGEVLVRVRAVGICGSDMHWYLEDCIGQHQAVHPQVLGHEPAGDVIAVGSGVSGLAAGQKVAIEPAIVCGECEFCRSGHHNNCVTSIFMGGPDMAGLFREYAVIPAHNAVPIPASMSFETATIIEPLSVMLHVLELVPIRLGDTVAVMGAGPIGLLMAMMARIAGASKVWIADRIPHRLELARAAGFGLAVDIGSLAQAILDETHGRGVDIVFDAAGKPETINTGFSVARLGGQFVLIGIPSENLSLVNLIDAMGKELNIQTVKRSNHNAHGAIELLEAGRIPTGFVTHYMPLEATPQAFETLAAYADGVGKVIIQIP
jgi:L-iditol 2-dehydrogenase